MIWSIRVYKGRGVRSDTNYKELGLIHVFDRLSILRGKANRFEILNLIDS